MTPNGTGATAADRTDVWTADTLRVAFVGEVDHGKSTLLGRLLLDSGAVSTDRLTTPVHEGGLAFLLDGLSEERDELFTLDTAQAVLETARRRFVLIDVPGHAELLKNMATGASRADVGVVVVDCSERAVAQTRRHLRVLELLGVTTCVGVVTKMDAVGYAEDVFRGVAGELAEAAAACGVELVRAVPVSALEGHNATNRSDLPALSWFDGEPLLSTLHTVGARRVDSALLRFAVQSVVGPSERRLVVGRVESGVLTPGTVLVDGARGAACAVLSIERFGEPPQESARPGDSVGLVVSGEEPGAGAILAPADQPLRVGDEWRVRVLSTSPVGFGSGQDCQVRYASSEVPARIVRVDARWDSGTATTAAQAPRNGDDAGTVRFSEIAALRLRLATVAPADHVRDCPPLGQFMLCDSAGAPMGVGIIDFVGDARQGSAT